MAQRPTSSLPSKDTYLSSIVSGTHGDDYQKNLALVMFERATRCGYDFKLATEMEIADKFDDVAFFNEATKDWTLIQVKHTDTSKGKPPPLPYEMLFPSDEGTRKKGDFSIYKYLKSYLTIQRNFKERTNCIIFTNRPLDKNLRQSIELEPRQVNEILRLDQGIHIGLKVKNDLIEQLIEYVNRDFNSLKNSIVNLFENEILDKTIKDFKTPVASMLTKTNTSVKFSEQPPPEAHQLYDALSKQIDIRNVQIPLNNSKDIFIGQSRTKTFPPLANAEIVSKFFQELTLSVGQPDDFQDTIDQDFNSWMRTWIRPDYFARLEKSQLNMISVNCKQFFTEEQSPVKHSDGSSRKKILLLSNGEKFLESMKQDLKNQFHNMASLSDASEFYISRQLEFDIEPIGSEMKRMFPKSNVSLIKHPFNLPVGIRKSFKVKIHDDDFVTGLSGNKHRFFFLTAEPGMGKSTVLQYIALAAQRKSSDYVYLFYLNHLDKKLDELNLTDTDDKLLSVLRSGLSQTNFNSLLETIKCNDCKRNCLLLFDAFDEVSSRNREKVLKIFSLILKAQNVNIIMSSRRTVKNLVDIAFEVETFCLIPFSDADQINFFRHFWKVAEQEENKFLEYVNFLFEIFHLDINKALCEFAGLPLMLKMLAEVYADKFRQHLDSVMEEIMSPKTLNFSLIYLLKAFMRKCFANKLMKKNIDLHQDIDEEYKPLFNTFTLEHQLLAIEYLQIEELQTVFKNDKHFKILHEFSKRIISGSERSPLVELFDNTIRFIHRSYAEFLVAEFLIDKFEAFELEIFGLDSQAGLFLRFPMIRIFVFAMIEIVHNPNHKEILVRHYSINKDIVLWACEAHNQKTVEFLLRDKYDSENINRLLRVAAEHNCCSICEFLIENHAAIIDVDNDAYHETMDRAFQKGHSKVIQILMSGVVENEQFSEWITPLHYAIMKGHSVDRQFLSEHAAAVNEKNDYCTPLFCAVITGQLNTVKLLIEYSADVNENDDFDRTPLHTAAISNFSEIVRVLCEHSADVNAQDEEGNTPLHHAVCFGHLESVKILIEYSADVNAQNNEGLTPLYNAVEVVNLEILQILMSHSADVHAKDNANSWTPLHYATSRNLSEIADSLSKFSALGLKGNINVTPHAIDKNCSEMVQILIEHSADVNAKDNKNRTPLHLASSNNLLNIIIVLCESSADVNAQSDKGYTPLHCAVRQVHLEAVEMLIEHSADVNAKDFKTWTPLHYASSKNIFEIVRVLCENSADVNMKSDKGLTPLHCAVKKGHLETVKILVEHSVDVNAKDSENWAPLHNASSKNLLEIVDVLCENSADVNMKSDKGLTPFHCAVEGGHLEMVKKLIEHSADVNSKNSINTGTPLHYAILHNFLEISRALCENSADVNAQSDDGSTPLHCAVAQVNIDAVKMLIEHSTDMNAQDNKTWTPLHYACSNNFLEIARVLCENSADVNMKSNESLTPLHCAVKNGHSEIVKMLTKYSADVNAQDNENWTPIHYASANNFIEITRVLCENSADVNIQTKEGYTPLHCAVVQVHLEAVMMLIEHSANVNAKDIKTWTPLHYASSNNFFEIAKALCEHSADVNMKSDEGLTPLQCAVEEGHLEMVKILTAHSANMNETDNHDLRGRLDTRQTHVAENANCCLM